MLGISPEAAPSDTAQRKPTSDSILGGYLKSGPQTSSCGFFSFPGTTQECFAQIKTWTLIWLDWLIGFFCLFVWLVWFGLGFCFGFLRQGFSVALEPILELDFVD